MLIKVKKGKAFMANRRHFTDAHPAIHSDFFGQDGEAEAQRLIDGGWCEDVTPVEVVEAPEVVEVPKVEAEPKKRGRKSKKEAK